jgi:hypothetical protein
MCNKFILLILPFIFLFSCTISQSIVVEDKAQNFDSVENQIQDITQAKLIRHVLEEKLTPEYKSILFKNEK